MNKRKIKSFLRRYVYPYYGFYAFALSLGFLIGVLIGVAIK